MQEILLLSLATNHILMKSSTVDKQRRFLRQCQLWVKGKQRKTKWKVPGKLWVFDASHLTWVGPGQPAGSPALSSALSSCRPAAANQSLRWAASPPTGWDCRWSQTPRWRPPGRSPAASRGPACGTRPWFCCRTLWLSRWRRKPASWPVHSHPDPSPGRQRKGVRFKHTLCVRLKELCQRGLSEMLALIGIRVAGLPRPLLCHSANTFLSSAKKSTWVRSLQG